MAVVYSLPPKSSRLINCSGVAVPVLDSGQYVFNNSIRLLNTKAGMVYLVNSVTFGTSISDEDFIIASTKGFGIVTATIKDKNGFISSGSDLGLIVPLQQAPIDIWYSSDTENYLDLSVKGTLTQIEQLVPVPADQLVLAFQFSVYEIPSNEISGAFRDSISQNANSMFRGGF